MLPGVVTINPIDYIYIYIYVSWLLIQNQNFIFKRKLQCKEIVNVIQKDAKYEI